MSPHRIQIANPTGVVSGGSGQLAAPVPQLAGTVGGFRVQWPSFDIFMEHMETLLTRDYGIGNVKYMFTGSDGTAAGQVVIRGRSDAVSWSKAYDSFASEIDWGIFGLGA